jgi:hypothetical protein
MSMQYQYQYVLCYVTNTLHIAENNTGKTLIKFSEKFERIKNCMFTYTVLYMEIYIIYYDIEVTPMLASW